MAKMLLVLSPNIAFPQFPRPSPCFLFCFTYTDIIFMDSRSFSLFYVDLSSAGRYPPSNVILGSFSEIISDLDGEEMRPTEMIFKEEFTTQ